MSYTTLAPTDFVVSSDSVIAPAWPSGLPTLTAIYTSSIAQSPAGQFYLDIYNSAQTGSTAQRVFSIAYGNVLGSGSRLYNPLVTNMSPSRTTYGQYRNLVYADETKLFNFSNSGSDSNDILVINIDRNMYKESMFPGTLQLKLQQIGSPGNVITITDDSKDVWNSNLPINYQDCGRVFNLVGGSYGTATTVIGGSSKVGYTASGSYGYFLPDIATIILNPAALALPFVSGGIAMSMDTTTTLSTPSSSVNNSRLYNAINGGACFQLNSQETISANYVFIRVGNQEYNYSNNPSFLSGSSGQLIYPTLVNSPQTYPTTVGLYNNNGDLLAVAKMSKPLMKDFTHEMLIRCKLDW